MTARWPAHLVVSVSALRSALPGCRETARANLWKILHAGLFASLRAQGGRMGRASAEDLEDLASQKALELLSRAEEGTWDPSGRADHEVAGYVARVARHALVDLARRRGRECPALDDPEAWDAVVANAAEQPPGPDELVAAREFAVALRECVAALAPRARHAWFRRVFLERPSREIGLILGLKPAHVDVVVQRARAALKLCMERRGHADAGVRPGAFVELWRHLSLDWAAESGEVET